MGRTSGREREENILLGGGGGGGGWGPQWKDGDRKVLSLVFELVVSNKPPAMCC